MHTPATSPLRIVLVPFGSEGDIAPFLWLADKLAGRGHHVRVAANPYFSAIVRGRGHVLLPTGSADKLRAMLEDKRVWDGLAASKLLIRNLLDSLGGCAEPFLNDKLDADLIVGSTFAFGASFAAEARRIPFVRLHLQPCMLRSTGDLPILGEGLGWVSRMPAPMIRGLYKLVNRSIDGAPLSQINRFRATLALPPLRSFYWDVCNSGAGLGGLFPAWFAPQQPDWPKGFQLFDFPLEKDARSEGLTESVQRFLAGGEAPILWTHGSANFHTADFARAAEQTCQKLQLRGIIVAPRIESATTHAGPGILRLNYAPFDRLFPKCRAIVHHGGIGTMAKGLQAGLPQLIVPRAYDQFDNAARAVRLGFGLDLRYRNLHRADKKLSVLLSNPGYATRARSLGQKTSRAPDIAVWLENIAVRQQSPLQ